MKVTSKLPYCLALIGFIGLFSLLMLWNTLLAPSVKVPVAFMLILTVTPLLLPMRGFLNGRLKSCAWMAYISLIYLIHGCGEAYVDTSTRVLGILEVILSMLVFFGASCYIRMVGKATP